MTDISHHRACHSAHSGSIKHTRTRTLSEDIKISRLYESFVCNSILKDTTSCNRSISLPCIAVSVCLPRLHSMFYQVLNFSSWLLPLFLYFLKNAMYNSNSPAKPSVTVYHCLYYTRNSKVYKPACHEYFYVFHYYPDISALTAGSQYSQFLLCLIQGFCMSTNIISILVPSQCKTQKFLDFGLPLPIWSCSFPCLP